MKGLWLDWYHPETLWGIGVSGGSDSLALLHLLVEKYGPAGFAAVLVDHGWSRKFAAQSGRLVAAECRKLDVPLIQLRPKNAAGGRKPDTNAEAQGRKVRYAAFAEACRAHQLAGIVLGHTRTDQVEQFLLRAGKGSGLTGLAGIPAENTVHGVRVVRPLLGANREELRAYLKARKVKWVDDPANARSARGQIRAKLKGGWLDEAAVAASAASLRRAEEALAAQTKTLLERNVSHTLTGWAVERAWLLNLPEELGLRLLGELIKQAGEDFIPRTGKRAGLLAHIRERGKGVATLGGLKINWENGAIQGVKLDS